MDTGFAAGEHGRPRGARRAAMVCDGVMNAMTLERPATTDAVLTAADRCDRCGARAWVRVTLASDAQLFFCAHHANQHLEAMVASAKHVLDERHLLIADEA